MSHQLYPYPRKEGYPYLTKEDMYNRGVTSRSTSSSTMLLPAFCARRIFCRLFQQQTAKVIMNKNMHKAPNAIPILALADRCGPHAGSPGIPQRPALSVKLYHPWLEYHVVLQKYI